MKPPQWTVTQYNQHRKFYWQQLIAQYPGFRRKALLLRLCIFIADTYHTNYGHVEFSIDFAAEALDCDPSQIARARRELVRLGWIVLVKGATFSRRSYSANQYDLGGGPFKVELGSESKREWVSRLNDSRDDEERQ